ncbi:glycine oxidase ThiO [Thiofaba sp. EF100]|jgi:glycine oxidase|uniref:glycine oxidase ThiO n=1 Tax=Thiofaba sp. EF100 TaxID=3121274 RepID=UPI003221402F
MSDFIIVGAGAIGMLTALALRQRGYAVTLIDRQQAGRESSWAGGGILSPLYPWRYADPVNALARRSQALYPDLVASLIETTGMDPEHVQSGLLMLDGAEGDEALVWSRRTGTPVERVGRDEIAAIQPGLAGVTEPGWWMPQVAQVRNPRLVRALRAAVELSGIRLVEGAPVERLELTGGRVQGVRAAGRTMPADAVVLAAGAWSGDLSGLLPRPPQVQPVRGQMLVLNAPGSRLARIVMRGGRYLIPRRDGRIVVGSTVEQAGFEKRATPEARESLHRFALELLPELREAPIEHHWAGLRPGVPAGIPYIGPHPAAEGLFLHTGHFRNGLVMGPASTELLVQLVEGEIPSFDPAPYALDAPRPGELH